MDTFEKKFKRQRASNEKSFSKGVPFYVVTFPFLLNVVRGPRKLRALRDSRAQRIKVQQKHFYILEGQQ